MKPRYLEPTIASTLKQRTKAEHRPLYHSLRILYPVKELKVNDIVECPSCGRNVLTESFDDHHRLCRKEHQMDRDKKEAITKIKEETQIDADERMAVALTRELDSRDGVLTASQSAAVKHVLSIANQSSELTKPLLIKRCINLGYCEKEVEETLRYIRLRAPIIIHVDLDTVLEPLLKDRYFRNQFETKTSKGVLDANHHSRKVWEHTMFKGLYDHALPFERVKYGSINVTNDPIGVSACHQYGDSYLVLKDVRFRTTFCACDSSTKGLTVNDMATCEHYAHVLNQYDDTELEAVLNVANGYHPFLDSAKYVKTYKEAQIAGPIRLDTDILAIVVHPRHFVKRKHLLEQFAAKNDCQLVWIK